LAGIKRYDSNQDRFCIEVGKPNIQIMGTYKNQFICLVKPYDLSEKGRNYLTKEYNLAEPITENSNPVILFVTVTE